jgi:hypothetical protein
LVVGKRPIAFKSLDRVLFMAAAAPAVRYAAPIKARRVQQRTFR